MQCIPKPRYRCATHYVDNKESIAPIWIITTVISNWYPTAEQNNHVSINLILTKTHGVEWAKFFFFFFCWIINKTKWYLFFLRAGAHVCVCPSVVEQHIWILDDNTNFRFHFHHYHSKHTILYYLTTTSIISKIPIENWRRNVKTIKLSIYAIEVFDNNEKKSRFNKTQL